MAVENQTATMYANNKHTLQFTLKDSAGAVLDLTGRLVTFALALQGANGPVLTSPLVDFKLGVSSQITVPTPANGIVLVVLLPADTTTLAPVEKTYYGECEVTESNGSAPVVVATLELTIKPNVENA